MNSLFKLKRNLITFLALFSALHATQGYEIKEDQLPAGYNSPARIQAAASWDYFFSADFVYWEAREKGLDIGYIQPISPSSSSGKVQNMEFEYKPGFKTGLALSFKKDSWNLYIEYTRYHISERSSHNNPNPADNNFYLNWFSSSNQAAAPNTASSTHSLWNLKYDMIDVNLGRPFYNGKSLTINPIFGGRGGWIMQQFSTIANFAATNTNPRSLAKSQSWLLGPRAGFFSNWLLGKGFRFFGNGFASLLYQNFHFVKLREQNYTTPTSLFANEKNKSGYVTFNLNAMAGFGYGTYFDHDKWNFDISAGYEIEYYFNQNMMSHLNDLVNFAGGSSDSSAGNLMMHGLTIKAILNF